MIEVPARARSPWRRASRRRQGPDGRGSGGGRRRGPRNNPSRSGVSQTTLKNSEKATGEPTVSPSIRHRRVARPSPTAGSKPVPMRCSSSPCLSARETANPPEPALRAMLDRSARRRPRPGEKSEIDSRRLVFPAPFSPTSATKRLPTARSRSAWLRKSRQMTRVRRRPTTDGSSVDGSTMPELSRVIGETTSITPASASAHTAPRRPRGPGSGSASRDRRA